MTDIWGQKAMLPHHPPLVGYTRKQAQSPASCHPSSPSPSHHYFPINITKIIIVAIWYLKLWDKISPTFGVWSCQVVIHTFIPGLSKKNHCSQVIRQLLFNYYCQNTSVHGFYWLSQARVFLPANKGKILAGSDLYWRETKLAERRLFYDRP